MGATTYGRRALRRLERATGERLAWATGPWVTTIDHRHFGWDGHDWHPLPPNPAPANPNITPTCGLPTRLSSCTWLFGDPRDGSHTTGLMRGPCRACDAACGELHHWQCSRLVWLLGAVNPDYWPRPVHRPMWVDDARLSSRLRLLVQLGRELGVPYELLAATGGAGHWTFGTQVEP